MNGRQGDNFFKTSVVVVVCVCLLLGNVLAGSGWGPNFTAAAFVNRPIEEMRYELKFIEIKGEILDEPLYFADLKALLHSDDIYEGKRLITQFGHAIHIEDIAVADSLSQTLEDAYLWTLAPAEYEVVFIDTDPIEKYNTNNEVSERVLSRYTVPLGE